MGAPAGQPCRTTTSATGRPMPVSRSQSRSGQVSADSGGREEVRCVQDDPVFSMRSSRGPTALLPLRQPARDKVPNILLVYAPCRDFPLGRFGRFGRFSDNTIRGVQDTVPTHPRSHIVDNSVMICRASLVGYSISSRHPRTSGSVSPRSGIRFRAPPIRFYLVEVSGRPPGTGRRCPTCYHRCQRNGRP